MTSMRQFQRQEAAKLPENFRKKLAVAVRSIQWSYAIFWATRQPGSLEWIDGYYNGDIKTRKTTQTGKLKADKIALQRSEQLRELYLALLDEDIDQQAKRNSAALTPEDLSEGEWYFLVCMSFVFSPGQGLPVRSLTDNQMVWLCDAHNADNTVFSRSLLAKSASIQTVVCFPHLGGVIELGVTEQISEDPGLVQHVGACLLDIAKPLCLEHALPSVRSTDDDKGPLLINVKADSFDETNEICSNMNQDMSMDSLGDCSQGSKFEESFIPLQKAASLDESRHNMEDNISRGLPYSMASINSIPETFLKANNACSSQNSEKSSLGKMEELRRGCESKSSSFDILVDADIHYKTILLEVLRRYKPQNIAFLGKNMRSGFKTWQRNSSANATFTRTPKENTVKRILSIVLLLCNENSSKFKDETHMKEDVWKEIVPVQRKAVNEKFLISKALRTYSKDNSDLIADHLIKYVQDLETRVEELESCMDLVGKNPKLGKSSIDLIEQTSDNYDRKSCSIPRNHGKSKRKASDHDEFVDERQKDDLPLGEVKVSMKEDVIIEMTCPYREHILLDIMDEVNRLHLEAHSVQSSTHNGLLVLTLRSKFRGTAIASVDMIKQSLEACQGKHLRPPSCHLKRWL